MERALWHTQVYELAAGSKVNMSKSTCLTLCELGDLVSLWVSVPREWVKILEIEFDPEVSGRKAWEKTETKAK